MSGIQLDSWYREEFDFGDDSDEEKGEVEAGVT